MSKPSHGNYYIVNKATTPDGKRLAMNYNGENVTLTVTEFNKLPTQLWGVNPKDSDLQFVSPRSAMVLMTGFKGSDSLTVVSTGRPCWAIRGNDGVYSVQDGGYTIFWSLQNLEVGAPIHCGTGTGKLSEYWEFILA